MRTYKGLITKLEPNEIFVFGSNTEGRHGSGNAKAALDHFGAVYGIPIGLFGQSYAIITKNLKKKDHPSISRDNITEQISYLYKFAIQRPHILFFISYMYTKEPLRSGYTHQDMADMFSCTTIPDNIVFEEEFSKLLTIK